MRQRLNRMMLCAALALAAVWPASAVQANDFTKGPALGAEELNDIRGGFLTPDGLEIGFGAVVRTFVDGSLALQTRLTWSETGPVETVEYGMTVPDISAAAAAGGIKLDGPPLEGVVVNGEGGVTAIVHEISSGQIANLVINNANNRDIRQTTDVTLDVPGLAQMQQDVSVQSMSLRLQDAIGAALRDVAR